MRVSQSGKKAIKKHEGEILRIYLDPVGLPTGGVGHLLTKAENAVFKVGQKITQAQSDEWLDKDLAKFEAVVSGAVTVPINQNQFDALVSLAFNIGPEAFRKSSVLRHLNQKNYDKAAQAFKLWNKGTVNGRKVVLPGLVTRRAEESALFLRPPATFSETKQNAPESINPESSKPEALPSPPSPTYKDHINKLNEVVGQAELAQSGVSRASKVIAAVSQVKGYLWLLVAFLRDNWVEALIGALILGIGIWYWSRAKDRAQARSFRG